MNRNEFFNVARLSRAPVKVKQFAEKGFGLSLIAKNEDETEQEFFLLYNGEPRYFKSLKSIETILRDKKIYDFTVALENVMILSTSYESLTDEQKEKKEQDKIKAQIAKTQEKLTTAKAKLKK